ncbi:MAG: hypothetical protein JNL05_01445 [Flavobacteriales bacterium]|nr:hypothetical protein [Flavobacteriales bacterium]
MRQLVLGSVLLGTTLRLLAQSDSTITARIAWLGGAEAFNAGGFEALVQEVGLPAPSASVFRQGLGLYTRGRRRIHFGAEVLIGSARTRTDSASARTYFFSMDLHLGYCLVRRKRFDLVSTLGYRINDYAYQADRDLYTGPFPQVSFRRPALSPGLLVRYGGRFSALLRTGVLVPLSDGRWLNDRNSQEITDGPPVRFQGFACLGLGYGL